MKYRSFNLAQISFLLLAVILLNPQTGFAKGKKSSGPTEVAIPSAGAPSAKGPKETDVEQIQEKYWARGDESEIGVVQNRLFTNRRKFELGFLFGSVSSDPFLVNTSLSATLGYHFSELFSFHLGYTKNLVGPSSALKQLEAQSGSTAATNQQKSWLTADTRWSLLYGKVSLFGSTILYFDSYLSGGLGIVSTESGSNLAFMPGIGQIYHINQTIGINIHYKLFWYQESILSKTPATLGNKLSNNSNFGSTIMLGITVTLDPFPAAKTTESETKGDTKGATAAPR